MVFGVVVVVFVVVVVVVIVIVNVVFVFVAVIVFQSIYILTLFQIRISEKNVEEKIRSSLIGMELRCQKRGL